MFRYFDTFYGIHSQKNKTLINLLSFISRNYFDINENDSIDIVEKFNLRIWMKNELFPFIFLLTISVLDNGISFFFFIITLTCTAFVKMHRRQETKVLHIDSSCVHVFIYHWCSSLSIQYIHKII